jgi:hypothetical protein
MPQQTTMRRDFASLKRSSNESHKNEDKQQGFIIMEQTLSVYDRKIVLIL